MYALWWDKPFDVERSVVIQCPIQCRDEALQMLQEKFEARYKSKFLSFTWEEFIKMQRIPNWAYMDDLGLSQSPPTPAFHIAPPGIIQPNPAYYMPNPSGRF
jgi:hypothetical protein